MEGIRPSFFNFTVKSDKSDFALQKELTMFDFDTLLYVLFALAALLAALLAGV